MPKDRTRSYERRKASRHVQRIAMGNLGNRRLKKARADDSGYDSSVLPSYLRAFSGKGKHANMASDVYRNTVVYLRQFGCLDKIPPFMIQDYVIARCYYMQARQNFVQSGTDVLDMGKKQLSPLLDAEIILGKNVNMAWEQIWDIVSRHGTITSAAK